MTVTLSLGSNISSLKSQRTLNNANKQISSVFERLSSGLRINRVSDDAAGLAISDSLKADVRIYAQGIRNFNDGVSLLNIAEGALSELTNIGIRLKELAEQAANGVLGKQQRSALDKEAQALSNEYLRIVKTTEFNGRKVLQSDFGSLTLQGGYGTNAVISSELGGAVGNGTFTNSGSFASNRSDPGDGVLADFNGDGILDIISSDSTGGIFTFLGNGYGSFVKSGGSITSIGSGGSSLATADFNNDGLADLVSSRGEISTIDIFLNDGNGGFAITDSINNVFYSPVNNPFIAEDFNGDGITDLITKDVVGTGLSFHSGNGDGSFGTSLSISAAGFFYDFASGDFDNDGIIDLIAVSSFDDKVSFLKGNGNGTFGSAQTISTINDPITITKGDIDGNGIQDLAVGTSDGTIRAFLGNGDGTFREGELLDTGTAGPIPEFGDFNGDGFDDIISVGSNGIVYLGNGDGTFQSGLTLNNFGNNEHGAALVGDLNGDGVTDIVGLDEEINVYLTNTVSGVSALQEFSLKEIYKAKFALSEFSRLLDRLYKHRGQVGAFLMPHKSCH